MKKTNTQSGFTLIELIIVIAIIAILAAAIFVAIDPAKRLNQSRNSRRSTDSMALLDALLKYQVDGLGVHAPGVATLISNNDLDYHVIAAGTHTGVNSCDDSNGDDTDRASCPYVTDVLSIPYRANDSDADTTNRDDNEDIPGTIELSQWCLPLQELSDDGYIGRIPNDPGVTDEDALLTGTGYYIRKNSNNSITFGACNAEGEDDGGTGTPPVIESRR